MKNKFSKILRYAEHLDKRGKHESADFLLHKFAADWNLSEFARGITSFGGEWILNKQDVKSAIEIMQNVWKSETSTNPVSVRNVPFQNLFQRGQQPQNIKTPQIQMVNVGGKEYQIDDFKQARIVYMPSFKRAGNFAGLTTQMDSSDYLQSSQTQQPIDDLEQAIAEPTRPKTSEEFRQRVEELIRMVQTDDKEFSGSKEAWTGFNELSKDPTFRNDWVQADVDKKLLNKIGKIISSETTNTRKTQALRELFELQKQERSRRLAYNPQTNTAYLRFNDLKPGEETKEYAMKIGRGFGPFSPDMWASLITMINTLKSRGYSVGAIEDGRLFPEPEPPEGLPELEFPQPKPKPGAGREIEPEIPEKDLDQPELFEGPGSRLLQ